VHTPPRMRRLDLRLKWAIQLSAVVVALGLASPGQTSTGSSNSSREGGQTSVVFATADQASSDEVLYRVNAGGPALAGSPAWSADTAADPSPFVNAQETGNTTYASTQPISMSDASLPAGTPAALFQDERWDPTTAPELEWNFPVSPGDYEVRLYFAEIWPGTMGQGLRRFDLRIEGQLVLDDYDVFAEVGANRGEMKSFHVTSDSNLDIDFGHVIEDPAVKGIEIVRRSTGTSFVEAESMAGGQTILDATASGGRALALFSNGTATAEFATPTANRVVVRARGSQCDGPPQMLVTLDGTLVRTAPVSFTVWNEYTAYVDVSAGPHTLAISFDNDLVTASCDRNLFLDSVQLRTGPPLRRVPLGTGVPSWPLLDETETLYRQTLLREFDWWTPENALKWENTEPGRNVFDFSTPDEMVALAWANGKRVHGHTLVWYYQLPAWLTGGTWTRAQLLAILQNHVKTVVGHYAGRIGSWDVVNEAFNSDGTYRHNIFYDTIGADYIRYAFVWAHEADPDAKLYYNDYGIELTNAKSTAVYNVVRTLRSEGIPIDGIGIQAHLSTSWTIDSGAVKTNMQRFGALPVDVVISEMDVGWPSDLIAQANVYRAIATACEQVSACKRFSTWGFTDLYTWLNSAARPLLFDTSYNPKPAYDVVRDTLNPR
jgi:GH35 family endo-1,4-beta-xylanase